MNFKIGTYIQQELGVNGQMTRVLVRC